MAGGQSVASSVSALNPGGEASHVMIIFQLTWCSGDGFETRHIEQCIEIAAIKRDMMLGKVYDAILEHVRHEHDWAQLTKDEAETVDLVFAIDGRQLGREDTPDSVRTWKVLLRHD